VWNKIEKQWRDLPPAHLYENEPQNQETPKRTFRLMTQCPGHDTTRTGVTEYITAHHDMTPDHGTTPTTASTALTQTRFWWWSTVTLDSGVSIPYSLIVAYHFCSACKSEITYYTYYYCEILADAKMSSRLTP